MKLLLFLIAHLLGDFVVQPYRLSEAKKYHRKSLLLHAFIYTIFVFGVLLIYGDIVSILVFTSITFLSHYIIDVYRIQYDKTTTNMTKHLGSFLLDQCFHLVILIIFSYRISANFNRVGIWLNEQYTAFIPELGLQRLLQLVFCYLFILSPTSVLIKHVLNCMFPNHQQILCDDTDNRVGSLIGKLERGVILTLGLLNLYSSIAIVLTAKSIARFRQLENRNFAEKYLVGTLLSLLSALLCLLILKFF